MTNDEDEKKQRFATLVDDNLKRLYSDLVEDELPDRFKVLLQQLQDQDSEKSAKK